MLNEKFRAWHKEEGKMYKVVRLDFINRTADLYWSNFTKLKEKHLKQTLEKVPFDKLILMQESGLLDDDGFSTFEGDIIKWEGLYYVIGYGWYGNTASKINGFGWYIEGNMSFLPYYGGGEKVGTIFEDGIFPDEAS